MPTVTVSDVIRVPRDVVYDLLSDYGGERRMRAFPGILDQRVVNRQGDTAEVVTRFIGAPDIVQDRRRFTLAPPKIIKEEILESSVLKGTIIYHFEQVPQGTRLTLQQRLGVKGQKLGFFQHFRAVDLLKRAGQEAIANVKRFLEEERGVAS